MEHPVKSVRRFSATLYVIGDVIEKVRKEDLREKVRGFEEAMEEKSKEIMKKHKEIPEIIKELLDNINEIQKKRLKKIKNMEALPVRMNLLKDSKEIISRFREAYITLLGNAGRITRNLLVWVRSVEGYLELLYSKEIRDNSLKKLSKKLAKQKLGLRKLLGGK